MSQRHRFHGLKGSRWERLRRRVLDAADWRCTRCGKYANEVDHVIPLHKGGDPWAESNLQALCKQDHFSKSRKENSKPLSAERLAWQAVVKNLI